MAQFIEEPAFKRGLGDLDAVMRSAGGNVLARLMICFSVMFLGWTFLAPFLARGLVIEKNMARADVILVLANSSSYIERTHKAALIYKQGVAPKVLLTDDGQIAGWSKTEQRNPPVVELAKRELVAQGVPADAIGMLVPKVSKTIMEAEFICAIAAKEHWKSLLIVTSAYHTRRALRAFERVCSANGVEIRIGIVFAATGQQTPQALYWWLSWTGWQAVGLEYIKSAYYYLKY